MLLESHARSDAGSGAGSGEVMVYGCTGPGCEGRLEEAADEDHAEANEPTGGDNIGA